MPAKTIKPKPAAARKKGASKAASSEKPAAKKKPAKPQPKGHAAVKTDIPVREPPAPPIPDYPSGSAPQKPTINSTSFGEVEINKKIYYSDMVVWWDNKLDFLPKKHVIGAGDIEKLLTRKPYAIVIGVGQVGGVRITEKAKKLAKDNNVKLFIDESEDAIDIFNGLVDSGKRAVAIIHSTC